MPPPMHCSCRKTHVHKITHHNRKLQTSSSDDNLIPRSLITVTVVAVDATEQTEECGNQPKQGEDEGRAKCGNGVEFRSVYEVVVDG